MKHHILSSFLFIFAACGSGQDSTSKWQSQYRKLSFQYSKPLTLLPTSDRKEKTLTGVIDKSDGKSYVIQVTDDISKERLNDSMYYEGVKETMLNANFKNKLLNEDSIPFHGRIAHRQVFLMYTDNWGYLKLVGLIIRTGVEFISIQISFPTTEKNAAIEPTPEILVKFDKDLSFTLK